MVSNPKRISIGTFPFAGVFTPVSEDDARKIIFKYLELGGYYIDTAPLYMLGAVETLVGKILKSIPRDNYYIASKCGFVWGADNKPILSGKKEDIISECEKSLKRLNVDYIDLYMSHAPDLSTPFEETVDALVILKKQGKIKDIGVSNVNLEQLKTYNSLRNIQFVQNRFSLLNRSFSSEYFSYCQSNNIGLIIYQVIERGLLTDKILSEFSLRENDLRNKKPEFAEEVRSVITRWVRENLYPLASKLNISVSSLAIGWALQQPAVAYPVFGATNIEQLKSNFIAVDLALHKDVLSQIETAYRALENEINLKYGVSVAKFMGLI